MTSDTALLLLIFISN